jgi:hypothetical protein
MAVLVIAAAGMLLCGLDGPGHDPVCVHSKVK